MRQIEEIDGGAAANKNGTRRESAFRRTASFDLEKSNDV